MRRLCDTACPWLMSSDGQTHAPCRRLRMPAFGCLALSGRQAIGSSGEVVHSPPGRESSVPIAKAAAWESALSPSHLPFPSPGQKRVQTGALLRDRSKEGDEPLSIRVLERMDRFLHPFTTSSRHDWSALLFSCLGIIQIRRHALSTKAKGFRRTAGLRRSRVFRISVNPSRGSDPPPRRSAFPRT